MNKNPVLSKSKTDSLSLMTPVTPPPYMWVTVKFVCSRVLDVAISAGFSRRPYTPGNSPFPEGPVRFCRLRFSCLLFDMKPMRIKMPLSFPEDALGKPVIKG
jgi:hypothetical protein